MAGNIKNKEIVLCGRLIAYVLKSGSGRRNLRITIKPGGMVAVAKPNYISERAVEDFLMQKSGWLLKHMDRMGRRKNLLAGGTRTDYLRLAPAARKLACERLKFFNGFLGLEFRRVAIRDQRTRWGSCSRRGNLNFNYRIALLPPHLSDYIIAHELCHLRHLNHSHRFWGLLAKLMPDYAARRRELRSDY